MKSESQPVYIQEFSVSFMDAISFQELSTPRTFEKNLQGPAETVYIVSR